MASDLTLMGHTVRLFQLPGFADGLKPELDKRGGIIKGHTASGKTGIVMPSLITTNPLEALEGMDAQKIRKYVETGVT